MTSYQDIRQYIISKIGSDVLDQILTYVHHHTPQLWGEQKPAAFLNESICIALYKDMTGHGYGKVKNEISFLRTLSEKSIRTNTRRIRAVLAQWGREQLVLGTKDDWEKEKKLMEKNPDLAEVNLWIDSTDFKKIRYEGMSKKGEDWSYKCNQPGLRFTMIESATRKIRKIWGGYTPKLHDGEFLVLKKHYFEKRLANAVIIGDEHYSKGKKIFERLKFRTPIRKPRGSETSAANKKSKKKRRLTDAQKKYNAEQRHLRSRVESPFSWIKENFSALSKPWQESDDALSRLVFFAAGCFNKTLDKVDYFLRIK